MARSMYHLTRRDRLASIMRDGLRGEAPRLFSGERTPALARRLYGFAPVYLSAQPWFSPADWDLLIEHGRRSDFALLEVDVSGLRLLPDVMSLVDHGAQINERDELWWADADHALARFEDPACEAISVRRLLSERALVEAAIALTGTAAVRGPIDPSRIRPAR
jgi:hypothetical protein